MFYPALHPPTSVFMQGLMILPMHFPSFGKHEIVEALLEYDMTRHDWSIPACNRKRCAKIAHVCYSFAFRNRLFCHVIVTLTSASERANFRKYAPEPFAQQYPCKSRVEPCEARQERKMSGAARSGVFSVYMVYYKYILTYNYIYTHTY